MVAAAMILFGHDGRPCFDGALIGGFVNTIISEGHI